MEGGRGDQIRRHTERVSVCGCVLEKLVLFMTSHITDEQMRLGRVDLKVRHISISDHTHLNNSSDCSSEIIRTSH